MILVLIFLLANMSLMVFAADLPGSMTSLSAKSSYTTAEDVVINWTEASNTTSYGITIRENDVKGKIVFDREGLTGTSLVVGKLPEGKYSFCMRAYNSEGKGPISPRTSFLVAAESIPAPTISTPAKSQPGAMKSSSTKSSYTAAEDVVINWTEASNAASYGITIRENDAKGKIVFDREGLTGTSLKVGKLPEGKYSFCMRAYNSVGKGPISPRNVFTVDGPPADVPIADETGYFETNKDDVAVRIAPSVHARAITLIAFEGDVVEVISSTVNESGNLWYEISKGYWVYSGNLRKHVEHNYVNGICECGSEHIPQPVSNAAMTYVTKKPNVSVWSRPYTKSSKKVKTIPTAGTKGTIISQARNSDNALWYKTIEGSWIYSGDVDLFDEGWLWPVPENKSVYSSYGYRYINGELKPHEGIDISRDANFKVVASRTGEVVGIRETGISFKDDRGWKESFGCYIALKHDVDGQEVFTQYSHLKSGSIVYYTGEKAGQPIQVHDIIEQGTQIGITGNTGHIIAEHSDGIHLHFSIGRALYNSMSAVNGNIELNPDRNPNPRNSEGIRILDKNKYYNNGIEYILER